MNQFKPENKIKDIFQALVLLTPVIVLYLSHYLAHIWTPGLIPTGFLQLDQPFYMAAAREYWDHGSFNLLYSNPADPDLHSPAIYFNLPVLILALLWKITGLDPGLLFNLFGLLFGWGCLYLCIRFWRLFCRQWEFHDKLGLLLFIWGGGMLVLAGWVWSVIMGKADNLFIFDPTVGWWFLNWGRNLVLPLEACYHFLFIGMVYTIYNKKYKTALLFPALLVLSHPFTGLQAVLIYFIWLSYERIYKQNKHIPLLWIILVGLILICHILYYLVYLPSFPSHQQVLNQWKLGWNLKLFSALLAYLPVLIPAVYVLYDKKSFKTDLVFRHFLITWIIVSLILGFNNLFIDGYQPLHFTRGYLWLAFFLAGYPWLRESMAKIRRMKSWAGASLISLLLLFFLLDNIAWFIENSRLEAKGTTLQLSPAREHMLDYLNVHGKTNDLLISDDARLGYFSLVYTPVRSVYSHWANTPDAVQKAAMLNAFRMDGILDKSWNQQSLFFALDTGRKTTGALNDSLNRHFVPVDTCPPLILFHQKN